MDYLNKHFNVELLEEDYGINGLDYIKTLTVEELEEEFGDYKKQYIVHKKKLCYFCKNRL